MDSAEGYPREDHVSICTSNTESRNAVELHISDFVSQLHDPSNDQMFERPAGSAQDNDRPADLLPSKIRRRSSQYSATEPEAVAAIETPYEPTGETLADFDFLPLEPAPGPSHSGGAPQWYTNSNEYAPGPYFPPPMPIPDFPTQMPSAGTHAAGYTPYIGLEPLPTQLFDAIPAITFTQAFPLPHQQQDARVDPNDPFGPPPFVSGSAALPLEVGHLVSNTVLGNVPAVAFPNPALTQIGDETNDGLIIMDNDDTGDEDEDCEHDDDQHTHDKVPIEIDPELEFGDGRQEEGARNVDDQQPEAGSRTSLPMSTSTSFPLSMARAEPFSSKTRSSPLKTIGNTEEGTQDSTPEDKDKDENEHADRHDKGEPAATERKIISIDPRFLNPSPKKSVKSTASTPARRVMGRYGYFENGGVVADSSDDGSFDSFQFRGYSNTNLASILIRGTPTRAERSNLGTPRGLRGGSLSPLRPGAGPTRSSASPQSLKARSDAGASRTLIPTRNSLSLLSDTAELFNPQPQNAELVSFSIPKIKIVVPNTGQALDERRATLGNGLEEIFAILAQSTSPSAINEQLAEDEDEEEYHYPFEGSSLTFGGGDLRAASALWSMSSLHNLASKCPPEPAEK